MRINGGQIVIEENLFEYLADFKSLYKTSKKIALQYIGNSRHWLWNTTVVQKLTKN